MSGVNANEVEAVNYCVTHSLKVAKTPKSSPHNNRELHELKPAKSCLLAGVGKNVIQSGKVIRETKYL